MFCLGYNWREKKEKSTKTTRVVLTPNVVTIITKYNGLAFLNLLLKYAFGVQKIQLEAQNETDITILRSASHVVCGLWK